MIRRATAEDLEIMADIVMIFWEGTALEKLDMQCDRETVEDFLLSILAAPSGRILAAVDDNGGIGGLIGGVVEPWIFNKNILMFTELGWFVKPEFRQKRPFAAAFLFKEILRWAKKEGAMAVSFSSTIRNETEMVRELYQNRGFLNLDNNFVGRL